MKQILITAFILSTLIAFNQNAICQTIILANCPFVDDDQKCLRTYNGEAQIGITVNFSVRDQIYENTDWFIELTTNVADQDPIKITKDNFTHQAGVGYVFDSSVEEFTFPIIPDGANWFVFALHLMTENYVLLETSVTTFKVCQNNNNRLSNPYNIYASNLENESDDYKYSNLNIKNLDDFKIYPNPIVSDFIFEYQVNQNEEIIFQIFDVEGRSIYKTQFKHKDKGNYSRHFNDLNLRQGVYLYSIQKGSSQKTFKVTKL